MCAFELQSSTVAESQQSNELVWFNLHFDVFSPTVALREMLGVVGSDVPLMVSV